MEDGYGYLEPETFYIIPIGKLDARSVPEQVEPQYPTIEHWGPVIVIPNNYKTARLFNSEEGH